MILLPRPDAGSPAALAGLFAAMLHLAGALKSAPPLAALPFDLTLAAAAALAPCLLWLLASRRWRLRPALAMPLAACGGLWLWMTVAGSWSPSREILVQKLPEAVLLGPAMLVAGLLVGADAAARRWLVGATLLIGPFVAASVAWGLATGAAVSGGLAGASETVRVQYQLAGLAMACAAALSALRGAEAGGWRRWGWWGLTSGLAAGSLLPGGRAALLSLGAAVTLAPAARLLALGRHRAALGWIGAVALAGAAALALLLADPARSQGLRTLERFTGEGIAASARPVLWAAALDWAGAAAPLGLGTGGFTIATGSGERRGLYPHNHALEALAEGGLPGLLLWLGAFGGGLAVLLTGLRGADPGRAGRMVALVVPVAIGAMVSTDLGNRMAWFALGLALSRAVEAQRG
ncbi:O-antigen ligase domain-containing protein [Roseomonas sp. OT10]|uniref:O-antigen ligase family protein n=1 Tax=Roseomonas cutis TaxID=2897332 RepID=UPI001E6277CF|nr:O-antigen ligase family protein [Roseomonas sp. OT10]UFN50497.1 O-antigen ligase domain-containing protein [Roseomonas sp. OT10]